MASKEVEVLDPAPTVEKLKKFASERVLNRRHFIAALGVAGAAAAGTELVRSGPTALAQQPKPNGYAQSDVLNFLLNVKYLKATLYSYVTQGSDLPPTAFANLGTGGVFNAPGKITFAGVGNATMTQITDLFNEMYYDELNQLITLRALLGTAVYARQTMNLLGTGATTTATTTMTQPQFIGYARLLEDLSASAFAGATIYLTGTNLEYVTQSLAVNGFHAGAVRLLAIQTGANYYSGQEITTGSAGAGSLDSFTGVTLAGSNVVYYTTPTNPIVAGTTVSGPGIPEGAVINTVNPPTVITGSVTSGSNQVTQVTVTPASSTIFPAVNQIISGTGLPTNCIITAVNGTTLTVGTVTGYTSLSPLTPIINGLTGVSGSGGVGMQVVGQTYPLAFAGGGGSGAVGTLTVLTATSFSVNITNYGSNYTSAPTVTATGLTVSAGGSLPSLSASVAAQPSITVSPDTLTLGFLAVATKSNATLTSVSSTANLANGQFLTGTNVPTLSTIASFSPSAATVTMTAVGGTAATASASSALTPTGIVTAGSSVITGVSSTSGLSVGDSISGTGIPTTATITGIGFDPAGPNITLSAAATATSTSTTTTASTGQLTLGSNQVIALNTSSLPSGSIAVGNKITGTGIPSGTTITSVGTVNTITLSAAATATTPINSSSLKATANVQLDSGANNGFYVYPTTGIASGQLVQDINGNIPPGTTVTGVSTGNNTIAISAPATGTSTLTNVATFTGTVVASYNTLSAIPAAAFTTTPPIAVGMAILGTNIAPNSVITALAPPVSPATVGTITISQLPSSAAGAEVTPTSTPPASFTVQTGTTLNFYGLTAFTASGTSLTETLTATNIQTVNLNLLGNVVLSQNATATAAAGTALTFLTSDPMDVQPDDPGAINFVGTTTTSSANVTGVSSTAGLAVGQTISGPGIPTSPVTTIATITAGNSAFVGGSPGSITLSQSATAAGTVTLSAYPANAATIASGGPNAVSTASPAAYQGFFDTASASTSSSNNPAGLVFARTFSQVLAVLYGSTVAQTYQGGFFPVGVSGNINFV